MKILITGNMGYIGPVVAEHFRRVFPGCTLVGFDSGYFAACGLRPEDSMERLLDAQYFGDMRAFPESILEGVDAVVHLAAVSNDPMGKAFESVTEEINFRSSIRLAEVAKEKGVRAFVFASSCSVYGAAEGPARREGDPLNPLTAYARSKVATEEALQGLAGPDFRVTCLRFATACGYSPRLRLDLVLNDFAAGALSSGAIEILSDGTPWRPLIDVRDMARAMEWGIRRDPKYGGDHLIINVGAMQANYQVKELAEAVAKELPGVAIRIHPDGQPDKRSYKVDFSLFAKLAPDHQPVCTLQDSVKGLVDGLREVKFNDPDYRKSHLMRLNMLMRLKAANLIDDDLNWK